jgi:GTP-binding protein HflX
VMAFRGTLEEAIFTDILIHLIDVSHPMAIEHAEATLAVLKELGAENRPMITVFNKIDACHDEDLLLQLKRKYPGSISVSALDKSTLEPLLQRMEEEVAALRQHMTLRIPQKDYAIVSELMREGYVLESDYEDDDVIVKVEIPKALEHKLEPFKIS